MQIASIAILMFGDITNQSKSYLYTSTVTVSLIIQDWSVY